MCGSQERESMDLQLSIGMANNLRTRAIFEDKVKPDGISLICTPLHASELFWRQLRFGDFDVSEMSLSSFLMAVAGSGITVEVLPAAATPTVVQGRVLF